MISREKGIMWNCFHEFFWNVKKYWNVFTKILLAKGTTECKKAIFKLQSKRVHFLPATKKQFVSRNSPNPPIFQGKSKTFCKMNSFDLFLFVYEKAKYWDFTDQRERAFNEKTEFNFCFGNWLQIFRAEIQKFLNFS